MPIVKKWFRNVGRELPQICAIDPGSDSHVIKNKGWDNTLFYFHFRELLKKINKYIPEDIYYDRNTYKNPEMHLRNMQTRDFFADANFVSQELVFDIDADNIPCHHEKGEHVCYTCIKKARQFSSQINKSLEKDVGFKKVRIVYSGRGFHLHVLDNGAFFLHQKTRAILAEKFSNFPIDPWVSKGNIELIRLPFSLHGLVSRVVTPINTKNARIRNLGIPGFLKKR